MATLHSFHELVVWQKARKYSLEIYNLTNTGSFSKDFALRNQIDRSSGSIPDNIAEGFERDGRREFVQALSIAKGSVGESRSQLARALDRQHIDRSTYEKRDAEAHEIARMLVGLMKSVLQSEYKGRKFIDPQKQRPEAL